MTRLTAKVRVDPETAEHMDYRDWELLERKLDEAVEWARKRVWERLNAEEAEKE